MKELFIYRGLPGSGKTTQAKNLQKNTGGRIVGRDHLRELLYGQHAELSRAQENEVTRVQERLIRDGLRADQKVIVDDMNLRAKYVRRFQEIARSEGAVVNIIDLTNVDIDTCHARNVARDRLVPDRVIEDLYDRFIKGQPYPLPVPEAPEKPSQGLTEYVPPEDAPLAIIVDLDGTVALHNGRSPYDYSKVTEDLLNLPVASVVELYRETGYEILFTSGRPDSCRTDTKLWIKRHFGWREGHQYRLFMRNAGDSRRDNVVKKELFDRHIRHSYQVEFVLDDRNQVVEMWRSLGLTCLQVAEGNF